MKSVISKLYYGELCPCEKPAPNTERYIKTKKTICSAEQLLLERFPECKELLDEYTDVMHIESQLECEADFIRGFRLGAALMLDILEIQNQ